MTFISDIAGKGFGSLLLFYQFLKNFLFFLIKKLMNNGILS